MQLVAVHQSGGHAPAPRLHEQSLEDFPAPTLTGFAQHAVIGNRIVEPVAQKPQVIQPLGQPPQQLALTGHVVEEQQKHQLQNHDRIDRDIPIVPVATRDLGAHGTEVNDGGHAPQRMIGTNALFQIDAVREERSL